MNTSKPHLNAVLAISTDIQEQVTTLVSPSWKER